MSAEILSTHTPEMFAAAVTRAADLLRAGELVGIPTETVYGLAANALNPDAVARIYAAKGRPSRNPIIVHVASLPLARACATGWPELADRLARAFWPGPLTLVVPKATAIPDIVTAGGPTVGIRWPIHPFTQALIRACGFPLAAPSANLANRLSPTTASHVADQLGKKVPVIVDGGDCNVGIESTVVDATGPAAQILRPGMISQLAVETALGAPVSGGEAGPSDVTAPLRSPGRLEKHYAPQAPLVVWRWRDEAELLGRIRELGVPLERTHVLAHSHIPLSGRLPNVQVIPDDPAAFARALYGELHRCDEQGASLIVVEDLPNAQVWRGIADRLQRASA